ncbi:uncharacterized protein LOC123674696 isoform X1 [Harmonia axyridis]|uniref:uncharacterized protein LOC123674696 isoform X1 n=1 Tax=Harmonia axyridis TaxID=115357 RepID=UPI001E275DB5|nr:uncharacterized protein LOC123674696 isoform X1 [Harmonia axyridis]
MHNNKQIEKHEQDYRELMSTSSHSGSRNSEHKRHQTGSRWSNNPKRIILTSQLPIAVPKPCHVHPLSTADSHPVHGGFQTDPSGQPRVLPSQPTGTPNLPQTSPPLPPNSQ